MARGGQRGYGNAGRSAYGSGTPGRQSRAVFAASGGFTPVLDAALSSIVESNEITLSDLSGTPALTITGGTYSKNGGVFTSTNTTVTNGDTLRLRLTSSASAGTIATATATIGGTPRAFSVTTAAATPTPTPTPSPSLSLSSAVTQAEGNSGTATFAWTLTLNRDGSTASYPYSWAVTGSGSNPANAADFGGSFPSGSGTFAPGETSKTITVLVTGDTADEPNETFTLTVTASGLNTVTSTGTISNDDSAPAGPVQSATIDSAGTMLTLVMSGVSAGSWGDYPIASDETMGVTLNTTSAGYDRSGGQAVANGSRARALKALRPLRRIPIEPIAVGNANANVLWETDNGNGTRTIRLRPSRYVYQGDTVSLSLAAGWRTGAPAQTIAVTNNSAQAAAPVLGGRWLTPPLRRVTGPFRADLMAGSLSPEGTEGLAAVRLDVTDGTTTKTFWATSLSTSTVFGDSIRCWGATIDPGGLNPGLITVHKTLFPWIGPSRTSGSGQAAATASFVDTADAPLVLAYDPAGTRYPEAWVMCDPVNGTNTASAAMVQPTLAAAKAVAAASKPASITCAEQAIYLANRSAAAANGGAALTRMADNARIVIPAGATPTPITGASVTSGLTSTECWPIVVGDPDDANPAANCILLGPASAATHRLSHLWFENMTIRLSGAVIAPIYWMTNNVTFEASSGSEGTTAYMSISAASFGYHVRTKIGSSLTALAFSSTNGRLMLARSCESPRSIAALAIVGGKAKAVTGKFGGTADSQADWVCVGVDMRSITGGGVTFPVFTAAGVGVTVRPLFLNNIIERIGATADPVWQIGENTYQDVTHAVIEGNTILGERTNTLYNDPTDAAVHHNVHTDCRVANSYFDWLPTKHDDFRDLVGETTGPNYGYRPALIEDLWFQDGLNCFGNVIGRRHDAAVDFNQRSPGRNGIMNPTTGQAQGNAWTKFTADASRYGTNAGGGDYRPATGSPLLGRAQAANVDVDFAGVARSGSFASGALNPPA